ncbi:MAG: membrane protein insertion efficiency factor YidD [Polynucleobacter sp.]|nr:membrane protein insertion efficiency factor YidD [Polynucleobacter sp.]MDZ4056237.1 membrane protein insertion efficiency factor YidD [Polynucleobacter sp.]
MQILNQAAITLIKMYQIALSPYFGAQCKFEPSCSEYACHCFKVHGPIKSTGLTLWRLLRCNPWSHGGYDPVINPSNSKNK